MSLYLAVFASDDVDVELDGINVGSYGDFMTLREAVCRTLEDGEWGSRFPTLMTVPDNGPVWDTETLPLLGQEVDVIRHGLAQAEAVAFELGSWQADVARRQGVAPATLADCFIDVDGEPLLERLADLVATAESHQRPIEFQ
ncbi:Imm70 family immunity protein [Knoellia sp. LjRoot47]|uniref:Imm70 family immunity protein n=1 Tax=Knoellia sp. LjRoot47 TaxID=3342330 RepID=UPI003ECC67A5